MVKYTKIPKLTGPKLIKLLGKDNWQIGRKTRHGLSLTKNIDGWTLVTVIPTSNAPLDDGTLSAILGPKQTRVGKEGLLDLINKYGL
jgi:predicted RNA binding protein YcfA (HicA-like mRNA interferase family)